jgi:hypothetical protein
MHAGDWVAMPQRRVLSCALAWYHACRQGIITERTGGSV